MRRTPTTLEASLLFVFALILWTAAFLFTSENPWCSLCISILILIGLSAYISGWPLRKSDITFSNFILGILGAIFLYGLFFLGGRLFQLLPISISDTNPMYQIRQMGAVFLSIFLLISPLEEIFWRSFLQKWTMKRFGDYSGWLIASGLYTLVHVASCDLLFIGGALISGLFWGFIYMKTKTLMPVFVCHFVWTLATFILWPPL